MPVSVLSLTDRRMEAESYLSEGYAIRQALEQAKGKIQRFGEISKVIQPGRVKGILVSSKYGAPFLAATQVFDIRPTPRKWLSLERTENAGDCFVNPGTIVVTRSGTVGKATLTFAPHAGVVLSDDLLRVYPKDERSWGWVYAFLRTHEGRAMATSARYGHVIKHLEISHLEALPIPRIGHVEAEKFTTQAKRILQLRNNAWNSQIKAEEIFADALGIIPSPTESGFVVSASSLLGSRRRLEAAFHTPKATNVMKLFQKTERLGSLAEVWWMSRFRRFYGEAGIPYLSADELFTINPHENKRILVESGDEHEKYFVSDGWIVMACSGQVYGLNGAALLATKHHEKVFFSHDLIRIVPQKKRIRPGYLLVALTHPTHGRPVLIRAAYGTSIPHLDPGDVADFPVVRLDERKEDAIADLAEAAGNAKAEADRIERQIATEASRVICRIAGIEPPGL